MRNNKNLFLIVDGSSLLTTSYYGTLPKAARKEKDEDKKNIMLQKLLPKNADGKYINAVQQFLHAIFTILEYQKPSHIAICWDCGRNTFRKRLWPQYKDNRKATPETLKEQYKTIYDICSALGFIQFMDEEYEADDFAGTLARCMEPFMEVRILTRDKDFFQLITDRTKIWYGMPDAKVVKSWRRKYDMPPNLPSKTVEINRSVLWEEFQTRPEAVVMTKALSGDASDNFPGIRGMGENRSRKLALHYNSPSSLYEEVDACLTKASKAALNRKWKEWGIRKSCYACLTAKGTDKLYSAREMADLCFVLGKIRTDIDLELYLPCSFSAQLFTIPANETFLTMVLKTNGIKVKVQKRKPVQKNKKFSAQNLKGKNRTKEEKPNRKKEKGKEKQVSSRKKSEKKEVSQKQPQSKKTDKNIKSSKVKAATSKTTAKKHQTRKSSAGKKKPIVANPRMASSTVSPRA